VTRRLPLALSAALFAAGPAAADAPGPANPCTHDATLKCPDLIMEPPSQLSVGHPGNGRIRLYATNHIVNIGAGPLEVIGRRSGAREMQARQVIHRRGGRRAMVTKNAGELYFKFVDRRRGSYWKYNHAARFELWSVDHLGTRVRLRRIGPKLNYCFRDLFRVRSYARTPRNAVYPACSQGRGIGADRLGVSPGWADVYPSTYPENWIDVTGLRGCFDFVHRADPLHNLAESREDNNVGSRMIRLPPRGGSVAPRGCP
jgi:hypothetical protein